MYNNSEQGLCAHSFTNICRKSNLNAFITRSAEQYVCSVMKCNGNRKKIV